MTTNVIHKQGLPRRLPLLGHALSFARDPLAFLETMHAVGDVVAIRLGLQTAYLINDPALVRRILVDATTFTRGVQAQRMRVILGNGIANADGAQHLRNRRLVQPAFHRQRIAGYAEAMRQETEVMTNRWREGRPVAVNDEITEVTLRVVGRTLFSTDFGAELVDEIVRSMPLILQGVGRRGRDPFGLLHVLPTAGNRRFNASIERIRDVVDRMIQQYRAWGVDHGDMASMLLLSHDAETGQRLSDLEVRDEVITILVAGTETTANTIAWVLHALGQRPDLTQRVNAEVDTVLGGQPVTIDAVPKLELIRRLISESLRLYPQAWVLVRTPTVPVTLGVVDVPAGAVLLLPHYALNRDPAIYDDPAAFDPDRWAPDRLGEAVKPSFLPFGAGRHQCIGEAFAWTEAAIALATVTQHWRLCPVPGQQVQINSLATLKPTQLQMTPHRRVPALAATAKRPAR
ncbi:MAG TPA: cytochrome P450 [Candidatus Limnocylindrales bacterium]|nr:cytochrome P450 [Candidatus Limnocylindrales bacterium]